MTTGRDGVVLPKGWPAELSRLARAEPLRRALDEYNNTEIVALTLLRQGARHRRDAMRAELLSYLAERRAWRVLIELGIACPRIGANLTLT
jgi:hypothetical protein